ncbi:MAG: recombinase zinc beta ribbon domain-containing protein [Phycisphaeraceae bacterium]|nr:recombinase zinc beta ribbon domain-containing protein [Phycisphaeraceae bacterium]
MLTVGLDVHQRSSSLCILDTNGKAPTVGCVAILSQDQWQVLIPEAHPGYISWSDYQRNQQQLHACAQTHGHDRRQSPPGQGPALLQGLVICGLCGQRMTVRYHARRGRFVPDYVCQRDGIENGHRICQCVPGAAIDEAIAQLLLQSVEPMNLHLVWAVQQELQTRLQEADRLRCQQVERARFEADLAKRRYMQVDPDNRLVADTLEAEWNQSLRALDEAQQQYERQREADRRVLDEQAQRRILALADDFPSVWRDPQTPDRERKRMVRLLLEDVTLVKTDQITVQIRFKGGAQRTLSVPALRGAWELRKTNPQVIARIDQLLDHHTDGQVAWQLNQQGLHAGQGATYTTGMVARVRRTYHLRSRYERLREKGMLTMEEMAEQLHVATATVKRWRHAGLLRAYAYDDKSQCLYEPPGHNQPVKSQGRKLSERCRFPQIVTHSTHEVQHAT